MGARRARARGSARRAACSTRRPQQRLQQRQGLVAERAAREEPAHRDPAGREAVQAAVHRAPPTRTSRTAAGHRAAARRGRRRPRGSRTPPRHPEPTVAPGGNPISAAMTGFATAADTTAAATSGDGGFDTSTTTSVPGSRSRARMASRALRPPTAADRSRPPTPITCDTPSPHRSSRTITSWAPVPAAATTPTRPEATRVGEAEAASTEAGRPRPGPHHQPADAGGVVLQRDLLLDAHVVAEQQDVQSGGQAPCALRARRTRPGTETMATFGVDELVDGLAERAGLALRLPGAPSSRTGTAPARPARARCVGQRRVGGAHRQHEIVRGRRATPRR